MTTRHSWSSPERFPRKTERVCVRCDLVKVTRHESGRHWVEFWRDGERVPAERTPACVVVAEVARSEATGTEKEAAA